MKKWFIIIIVWIIGTIGGWKLAFSQTNLGNDERIIFIISISLISLALPIMLSYVIAQDRKRKEKERKWKERVEKYNLHKVTFRTGIVYRYSCFIKPIDHKSKDLYFNIDNPPREIIFENESGKRKFLYRLEK